MSRKIIDKKKFSWKDDGSFRLNYRMVFDEQKPEAAPPDVDSLLREQHEKWLLEREKIRTEAFEKGREQGRREGYDKAAGELEARLEPMRREFEAARAAWKEHQEALKPGLLNLVFDISEAILGVPITNGTMRNKLEEDLRLLLQELDRKARPVLWVSSEDFDLVESLQNEYAEATGVVVRVSSHCNPGEFQLETNREKVVRDFRQMLHDFKESLILPK
ncbi:FliH/SctL family protein [Balneolales bacterium ANBcel1]|nr:FliH/SctL family protein [Balneolales bacterium ANBcel1]